MEQLAANRTRFQFVVSELDAELRVNAFEGSEGISRLFEIELELACENLDLPFDSMMGTPASLTVAGRAGQRYINGIISRFELSGQVRRFAIFRATLVPYLWFFRHRRGSRIFQDLSTDQIITQILRAGGVPADDFRFVLLGSHPVRDYCVQYRESELDFICRLMEEEGIFFYFEHQEDRHILVMADSRIVHAPVAEPSLIPYRADTNITADEEYIRTLRYMQEIKPGRVTLRGFDFRRPQRNLEVGATSTVPGSDPDLEVYDYPGDYELEREGQLFAEVRLQEHRTPGITIKGESDCKRLIPGYFFDIEYHPRGDINRDYLIIHLHHSAKQPQELEESAGPGPASYTNRFEAVPADADYRPPRVTHRPVVEGSQTAFVVGPAGEEIYVDKYGRVKVQFHWDRKGQRDEHSSCWIRVNQTIAGAGWGSMFIPRIGQEVIVDFLEGDPDQPIIVGRVYNGQSMPPYGLPAQGVVSGIKSNTVKGKGYNEISFNDTAGTEHFNVHAQYNLSTAVGHDRKEKIGNDESITIANNKTKTVGNNEAVAVAVDKTETVGGNDSLTVGGNSSLTVAVNRTQTIGIMDNAVAGVMRSQTTGLADIKAVGLIDTSIAGLARVGVVGLTDTQVVGRNKSDVIGSAYSLHAYGKATIEAPEIVLKAGGGFIRIDGSGVIIQGADVWINCGKSADGAAAGGAAAGGGAGEGGAAGSSAGGASSGPGGIGAPPGTVPDLTKILSDIISKIPGVPPGVAGVLNSLINGELPSIADILKSIPPKVLGQHGSEILQGVQTAYDKYKNPPTIPFGPAKKSGLPDVSSRPGGTLEVRFSSPDSGSSEPGEAHGQARAGSPGAATRTATAAQRPKVGNQELDAYTEDEAAQVLEHFADKGYDLDQASLLGRSKQNCFGTAYAAATGAYYGVDSHGNLDPDPDPNLTNQVFVDRLGGTRYGFDDWRQREKEWDPEAKQLIVVYEDSPLPFISTTTHVAATNEKGNLVQSMGRQTPVASTEMLPNLSAPGLPSPKNVADFATFESRKGFNQRPSAIIELPNGPGANSLKQKTNKN